MPKKKTECEFINEIKFKHPDMTILGNYVNSETKILTKHNICGYEWMARPASLSAGFGCPKCGNTLKKTHEEFVNQIEDISPNIKIISKYKNSQTSVLCECKIDGTIWSALPQNLLRGKLCPGCSGRIPIKGKTDIATLRPDIGELFADPNDAKKYKPYSKANAFFKCKYCGNIEKKNISSVSINGFTCKKCNDFISYPNKFIRSFLNQCNVDEKQYEYTNINSKYAYDAYFKINDHKYVVEMDGIFHFTDNKLSNQTLEQSKNIDSKKDILALENGYTVIRIDSRFSNKEYIENNIRTNDILNNIFNMENINFQKCDEDANGNYIYSFCKYYKNNIKTKPLIKIINDYGISLDVFVRYYSMGLTFNWCE